MLYLEKCSGIIQELAHGLASSEQARRVTDWRRWEMVQLKDRQPQEMESKLKFHSSLTLMAQVLVPCWIQFYLAAWKKTTQWCLGSSSFSLVIDGIVALNCILNGCCTLPMKVQFLRPMPQKLTVPPQEVTHMTGRRYALWHLWKSTT